MNLVSNSGASVLLALIPLALLLTVYAHRLRRGTQTGRRGVLFAAVASAAVLVLGLGMLTAGTASSF